MVYRSHSTQPMSRLGRVSGRRRHDRGICLSSNRSIGLCARSFGSAAIWSEQRATLAYRLEPFYLHVVAPVGRAGLHAASHSALHPRVHAIQKTEQIGYGTEGALLDLGHCSHRSMRHHGGCFKLVVPEKELRDLPHHAHHPRRSRDCRELVPY